MTVPVQQLPITKQAYSGAGNYDFTFRVFEETDITVTNVDEDGLRSELTLSTDYTVALTDGGDSGGTVTIIPNDLTGLIEIRRTLPITQETAWPSNNAFRAILLEYDLDKAVMILQEIRALIDADYVGVKWAGDWVTATSYAANDMVLGPNNSIYVAVEDHTSGTWATDLAAGKWLLAVDFTDVFDAAADAETYADAANSFALTASAQASAAASSAWAAASSEDVALAAANFEGSWSAGTYTLPSSVFHDGDFWILVAASTTGTPGVSSDWEKYSPRHITVDTTFYLTTTGSDLGDGSVASPWYSLEKAFDYLKDKVISTDVTVTISIAPGTYTGLSSVTITHPNAAQIVITGGSQTTCVLTFTGEGLIFDGVRMGYMSNFCLKGSSTTSYTGLKVVNGAYVSVGSFKLDTWGIGVEMFLAYFDMGSAGIIYNCKYGVEANYRSHFLMSGGSINCNSIASSYGVRSQFGSYAAAWQGLDVSNAGVGYWATNNAFIQADNSTATSCTTDYDPAVQGDVNPTLSNAGSWIFKT